MSFWTPPYAGSAIPTGDPEVERLTAELIDVSTRQDFAFWLTAAKILRGWARSTSDDAAEGLACIEEGIRAYRAAGAMLYMPYILTLKAEALHRAGRAAEAFSAINEAEALIETFGERWWGAELYRLRGVLLAALDAGEPQIEVAFCAAVRLARHQKSTSLARRAEAAFAESRRKNAKAPSTADTGNLTSIAQTNEHAMRRYVMYFLLPMWDVSVAIERRKVLPREQHTHSFLEMLPFCAVSFVICLYWERFRALFGQGSARPRFGLRLKQPPLEPKYLVGLLGAMGLFVGVPYGEELLRCWRAQRKGLTGPDTTGATRERSTASS